MKDLCDLKILVNGRQTFLLTQKIMSRYSNKFITSSGRIKIDDFPGGPEGFELLARFCYNNCGIKVTPCNVCLLRRCAMFLEMDGGLLKRTEAFLDGMEDWSWGDALICLTACEKFFPCADSYYLAQRIIHTIVIPKIYPLSSSSSSTTSSSETTASEFTASGFKPWWFGDLTILPPTIVQLIVNPMKTYGNNSKNRLLITRFLLYYLKFTTKKRVVDCSSEYRELAESVAHGVAMTGKENRFSCRRLFSVLRIVSRFGASSACKAILEEMIGESLHEATLDDLLVRDGHGEGVYDVDLVGRLIRVFVMSDGGGGMMKVGRLVDNYLREIAPDQKLAISKFMRIAGSLPDIARDYFDGVYRAIDIYLQAHPRIPFDERSTLCECLNYSKLTLETCKDLAKNPAIPPSIAVQALMTQSALATPNLVPAIKKKDEHHERGGEDAESLFSSEEECMKMKLQKMHSRVIELEKVCRDVKGQMSKLNNANHNHNHHKSKPNKIIKQHKTASLPILC